ncbi:LCP family protein [Mycobacterium shimoidei]|nr:LCP family protein [Mycobacterium shimoidei]
MPSGGGRGAPGRFEIVVSNRTGGGKHRRKKPAPWQIRRRLARGVVALVSVLAVLATGAGWWVAHGVLGGVTVSQALGSDDPHSAGGAMNILLIGLDSRKDQDGNELPWAVLKHLHAGDSDDGGYNTNTLILVHVGTDDKVSAFSIPRDDYVRFTGVPGYDHIKIKEAYGLTKAYTEEKLMDKGVSDQKELETKGREAGRSATLRAVRNLTGVPIDYFAEINLAGFYDLTQSLGGVQVCLKHAVYDPYSGADFPAGRQTLNAEQALSFVRQRHGLENGDLDRTHRQQAFLSSVVRQLQDSGTFTDLSKLKSLMAVARKDVVLSAGWDESQFRRMGALAGADVEYRTLPVLRYENVNGQDVNIVDPRAIKAEVAAAFGMSAPAAPNPSTVVDVVNASDTGGLASKVSRILSQHGYAAGTVRDSEYGESKETTVDYGPGAKTDAQSIAALLGIDAADHSDSALSTDRIQVVVGDDYSVSSTGSLDRTTGAASSYYGSHSTTSTEPTPDQGAPIDGGGVPCVN